MSTPCTTEGLLEEIEEMLIREGYVAREVPLPNGREAHFWVKAKELVVLSLDSETTLPYFDPTGISDEKLAAKLKLYLTFW